MGPEWGRNEAASGIFFKALRPGVLVWVGYAVELGSGERSRVEGAGYGLGLGAHFPDRLLELARGEAEVGLHLGSEVGVVLEAQTLCNHL